MTHDHDLAHRCISNLAGWFRSCLSGDREKRELHSERSCEINTKRESRTKGRTRRRRGVRQVRERLHRLLLPPSVSANSFSSSALTFYITSLRNHPASRSLTASLVSCLGRCKPTASLHAPDSYNYNCAMRTISAISLGNTRNPFGKETRGRFLFPFFV